MIEIRSAKVKGEWELFLDDERVPGSSYQKYSNMNTARTFEEAVNLCKAFGCPVFISFDHDLGEGKSGMDFAHWLIEKDLDTCGVFIPDNFSYDVHSQNPIGAQNIKSILNSYLKVRGGHYVAKKQ